MSALSALKQRLSGRRSLQIGARQLEIGDRLGSGPSPPSLPPPSRPHLEWTSSSGTSSNGPSLSHRTALPRSLLLLLPFVSLPFLPYRHERSRPHPTSSDLIRPGWSSSTVGLKCLTRVCSRSDVGRACSHGRCRDVCGRVSGARAGDGADVCGEAAERGGHRPTPRRRERDCDDGEDARWRERRVKRERVEGQKREDGRTERRRTERRMKVRSCGRPEAPGPPLTPS